MSDPIRLYLTRHGRTPWNLAGRYQGRTDIPLDDVGRAQSEALAETLRGQVQAIIASDLARARETAQIVSEALGIPLLGVDPDLRERGYGIFEGLTRDECIEKHPDVWAAREGDRNFAPPGSESFEQVTTRVRRALTRAVESIRGRHDRLLVIGHGSALRMFVEAITGGPAEPLGNLHYREVLHDGARFIFTPRESRSL